MKLTRRQAAALLAAPEFTVRSQAPSTTGETPQELLTAARERLQRNAETLSKVSVPAATEPAFQFRAS